MTPSTGETPLTEPFEDVSNATQPQEPLAEPAPTQAQAPSEPPVPKKKSKKKSMRRRVIKAVAITVAAALVASAGLAVFVIRRPLPQLGGQLRLPGLESEVRVLRDERGVPHIFADTAEDLFRAQGFVHAQDRFFEMDLRRHVASGRHAELVGNVPEAIAGDKVVRTLGFRQVAEQEWPLLNAETQAFLAAYAEGINAYIAGRSPQELAIEYLVLGFDLDIAVPEPWTPIDSLTWLKAVAWELRGNYELELQRAQSYLMLGDADLVDSLFPPFEQAGNPPILSIADLPTGFRLLAGHEMTPSGNYLRDVTTQARNVSQFPLLSEALAPVLDDAIKTLSAFPTLVGRGVATGSNSFVVSGEFTASGLPMLANDPHTLLTAPGVWTQMGLHCNNLGPACPFNVAGFGFAGFPGVMIGHNGELAWGLTSMGADVADFFIERLHGDEFERAGTWQPLTIRRETIYVNRGEPIELTVRSTGHGPVISTVLDVAEATTLPMDTRTDGDYAISLAWTALTPGRTADAIFALNTARNAADIQAAAALFEVPTGAIVFATAGGDIGFQASGRIPIRREVPGSPMAINGTWPRDGRDPRFDWQGYVDPEDMPRALNPAAGFIVAANQAVLPTGVGPYLSSDWDYGFRAARITDRLQRQIASGELFTARDFNLIQIDVVTPLAEILLPALLSVPIEDPHDAAGQRLLEEWSGEMYTDSAAAAYFAAVWRTLLQDTFGDDLPPHAYPDGGSRWATKLERMLVEPDNLFWDDRTTLHVRESRDEVLLRAMVNARRDLTVGISKNPADWRWGTMHRLQVEHPVIGGSRFPNLVRRLVNLPTVEVPGGIEAVNAFAWDASSRNFRPITGPSMRMVIDLGDIDGSTWVNATGVSGHPGSRHYRDQMSTWAGGGTFGFNFTRRTVEEAAHHELVLRP